MSQARTPQRCPGCRGGDWSHARLAEHLAAWRCGACGGHLLSLADYRRWRSVHPAEPALGEAEAAQGGDAQSDAARLCPACGRIMSRLRGGSDPAFVLDRCNACQWLWLDAGEWRRLQGNELHRQLDRVLSDGWQRRLEADDRAARREDDLRRRLGDEVFDEALRIRAWLERLPRRQEVLRLLSGAPQDGD